MHSQRFMYFMNSMKQLYPMLVVWKYQITLVLLTCGTLEAWCKFELLNTSVSTACHLSDKKR